MKMFALLEKKVHHGLSTGGRFPQELIDIQREQQRHNKRLLYLYESRDHQLQESLAQQNKLSLSLTLPSSEVQVFDGDPVNYYNFVQSFTNLIEAKTTDSKLRLHYFVQYTCGDVHNNEKLPSDGTRKGIHLSMSSFEGKVWTRIQNRNCSGRTFDKRATHKE